MMREILFRGKREKTSEWVEGYLVKRDEPFLHDIVIPVGNTSQVSYAIIRGTVGQYTGLDDCTGKRIFEGDIVCYRNAIFRVEWSLKYCAYLVVSKFSGGEDLLINYDNCEVIGNRFDNPELLVSE